MLPRSPQQENMAETVVHVSGQGDNDWTHWLSTRETVMQSVNLSNFNFMIYRSQTYIYMHIGCQPDEPLASVVTTNRIFNVHIFLVVTMFLLYSFLHCLYSVGNKITIYIYVSVIFNVYGFLFVIILLMYPVLLCLYSVGNKITTQNYYTYL